MKNIVHEEIDGEDSFITVSIKDLHTWALEAMNALSDGMTWHKMNEPENSHPLIIAAPEECADAFVYTVLMRLAEDGIASTDVDDSDELAETADD